MSDEQPITEQSILKQVGAWVPNILTILTIIYFMGMRDQSQTTNTEMVKGLVSDIQTIKQTQLSLKKDFENQETQLSSLRGEISALTDMKRDVACLKNAFITGGDPSKC